MADKVRVTPVPHRVQMNFTMANIDPLVIQEVYDAAVIAAVERGLIFDWGVIVEMDPEDIPSGSELEAIVLGINLNGDEGE